MRRLLIFVLIYASVATAQTLRVYVAEQESWMGSPNLVTAAATNAPSRTEQIHNLSKYCSTVTITEDQSKADLIVVWESKSYQQTRWGGHEHEWTIYNPKKDLVASGADYHMKNAAKDICKALGKRSATGRQ